MKIKSMIFAMMMVMCVATSVSAAVPSGYDENTHNDTHKITDWRRLNYEDPLPGSGAAINIERVTREEARNGVKMD